MLNFFSFLLEKPSLSALESGRRIFYPGLVAGCIAKGNAMKKFLTVVLTVGLAVGFMGCGKKADETKPIEDVKAEAQKMEAGELEDRVACYKDALTAKETDLKDIQAKIKDVPPTEALGDKAKTLKDDLAASQKSVAALAERMDIYKAELAKKTADAAKDAKK